MRSLILVTILCLISSPAFACVFHTDCNPGATCEDVFAATNGLCKTTMTSLPAATTMFRRRGRPATTTVIAAKAVVSRAQA